ncbi:MAG: HAD hydrolase-like protein [Lachnospiraceae bacterium]|nr:HAD hydrolase-like protein [Lachnospiraceae bacterium]MDD7027368.1 HAD hydrolase-like protein [Lachnospiraceae bacterium]MDY5700055.1 HAD hydrolase-like protein [Lachnospiraceae bacterium]
MFQYVLFDLDGTLTDPKEGITKSVQYALKAFGVEEENLDKLECFIGPPLRDSFMEFYHFDEQQAREAITVYRQRFEKTGLFENKPYEGIEEVLKACKDEGMLLAVASSKPYVFVRRILEHFGLMDYFDAVAGAELDGTREKKEEVIEESLRQLEELVTGKGNTVLSQIFNYHNCCMVGDRKFDVEGGKRYQLYTMAVGYGYADENELETAGADRIVNSVKELKEALLAG